MKMNDLRTKAIQEEKRFFPVRDCSICGYMMGYEVLDIHFNHVGFNTGCDCVTYKNITQSSWDEMEKFYNTQSPEGKKELDKQWWGENE